MLRYLCIAMLLTTAYDALAGEDCKWIRKSNTVGGTHLIAWQMPWAAEFFSFSQPDTPEYRDFLKWASLQPNLRTPQQKIEAERNALQRAKALTPELQERFESILSGKVGRLSKIRCIEALLMGEANNRREMRKSPYEIGALILWRSEDDALKIYLGLGDTTSVPMDEFESLLERDIKAGWRMWVHIHNHPFSLEKPYDENGGYTAPSTGDLQFYKTWRRKWRLEEAWITNGVYSYSLMASEFDRLP